MKLFILLLMLITALNVAAEVTLPIGEFSRNRLNGWEQKSFSGETRYQLQTLDGVVVLRADSHAAGSGLFKEQSIFAPICKNYSVQIFAALMQ